MSIARRLLRGLAAPLGLGILALGFAVGAAGCGGKAPAAPPAAAASQPSPTPASAATPTPGVTKTPLKLLTVQPDSGQVGAAFTVTGEGLPSNKAVDLLWATYDGSFDTNVMAETIEFAGLRYVDRRAPLARGTTDSQGRLSVNVTAPQDYGGVHDIYVMVDGQAIARGGFQIQKSVTVSPKDGPLGTLITITLTGMGKPPVEHAYSVRYDNQFTGTISGITTRGTSTGYIRASGAPGVHAVELSGAGNHGAGYLNNHQSPYANLFPKDGAFRFTFTVTADGGPPPASVVLPDAAHVAQLAENAPRTTRTEFTSKDGVSASLSASRGPILTPVTVTASGLRPQAEVKMAWMTAKGNRVTAAGWELIETALGSAVTDASGALRADIKAPEGLGGWHNVALSQDETVVAEIPFYVQPSLVGVSPARVKEGEQVTVHLKGIGWTELDNTVAVTYDNSYMGYACGFNSNGDVTIYITATGGPGTHLIDIYPTTFQGKATGRWGFQLSQLNALEDHPGLGLGYSLPVFRLAIEVVR